MLINKVLSEAQKHFPDLKIKFKDESRLMKLLSHIIFFNNKFMTNFTTTIGSTIYFPSKQILNDKKQDAFITLLHELVHIWDSKQNIFFKFLYLFPQILVILLIPLLFVFSWKIIVPLMVLSALPIPAYFRMQYEKRAYFISLYVMHNLSKKHNYYNSYIYEYKDKCLQNFKNTNYYFMWTFSSLDKEFDNMLKLIKNDKKPIDGLIMLIIDELISKI